MRKGFTLIELMVTISVIGILAAVTITLLSPSFFFGKGRDTHRQSDLQVVRSALEQYYLDNGRLYPAVVYADLQTPLSPYLDAFPTDPKGGAFVYVYSYSASDQKCYQLSATMEVVSPSTYNVCAGSLVCQSANGFCP